MSLIDTPMHPGEVLADLWLEPLGLSAGALARALHVPRTRIERIVNGETGITPDTALRLSRFLRTTPELWLNMQTAWDVARAREASAGLDDIEPLARGPEAA